MVAQTSPTPKAANAPEAKERVLSTLNKDGSRRWLKPRPMPGRFMTARRITAWVLILVFTAIPYIHVGGRPLVLLDLPARRFTIFGMTFLPTDTLLLALFMVSVFVTVFLLTALFGRVWCGWACPQTVYLEFVYRPIERLFEGTPGRRKRAFQGSPGAKAIKYVAFLLVSMYLAHTFLAYFVGVEQLAQWMRRSPFEHPTSFVVMLAVTGLMMFDFSFFREQTCIVACPYGRFQSVMLDRDSLIVTYDEKRGEPRGKARRAPAPPPDLSLRVVEGKPGGCTNGCSGCGCEEDRAGSAGAKAGTAPAPRLAALENATGDCVDCGMCTVCCPTGIDIRDGLQMECIGCAQCIDACDAVMTKLDRPTGLIRYSSQAAVEGGRWHLLRPRVVLYPLLLTVLLTAFTVVLLTKGAFDLNVLRGMGRPFTELADGSIANPARVKLVNRSGAPATYSIAAIGHDAVRVVGEDDSIELAPGQTRTVPVMIEAPRSAFEGRGRLSVRVEVTDSNGQSKSRPFELQGPASGPRTSTGAGAGPDAGTAGGETP